MEELVSVVVPAYNVGQYITECIKSVQNQTYPNWELIIVDDGSKDDTCEIVHRLAALDSRIRLHQQPNAGVSAARNKGLSLSKGRYVIFLDGDDYWVKECLHELVSAIVLSSADVSYSGYNHVYSNGFSRNYRYEYPSGNVLLQAIQGKVRFHIGALLIDKALLERHHILFTEGCLVGQDLEVMLKVAAVAKVQAVPLNLLMYRVRPNSAITAKWKWEKHIHAIKGYRRAAEFILIKCHYMPEFPRIQSEINKHLALKVYTFLWRMVKNGAFKEALACMTEDEFVKDLSYLQVNELGLINRIKWHIILSGKRTQWNFAKYFQMKA